MKLDIAIATLSLGLSFGCSSMPSDVIVAKSEARVSCSTTADCAPGLRCEAEGSGSFCAVRRDDDDRDAARVSTCAVDLDCAVGQECELEHGVGTCKAHRGAHEAEHADGGERHGGDDGVTPDGPGDRGGHGGDDARHDAGDGHEGEGAEHRDGGAGHRGAAEDGGHGGHGDGAKAGEHPDGGAEHGGVRHDDGGDRGGK